jgi:hypothetical protein
LGGVASQTAAEAVAGGSRMEGPAAGLGAERAKPSREHRNTSRIAVSPRVASPSAPAATDPKAPAAVLGAFTFCAMRSPRGGLEPGQRSRDEPKAAASDDCDDDRHSEHPKCLAPGHADLPNAIGQKRICRDRLRRLSRRKSRLQSTMRRRSVCGPYKNYITLCRAAQIAQSRRHCNLSQLPTVIYHSAQL